MRYTNSLLLLAFASTMAIAAPTPTPAPPSVKAGVDAWGRGDYPTAIKVWRPLAIAGDADAQFNLGQAYKLGRGVPVDLKLAEDWYRRAALQGHFQAEDNYGLILFQNGERDKAVPYIQKSADRGEPRAQYVLGTALFNGDQLPKDWVRAYALMTRSSASGLTAASASLSQMDKFIPIEQRQQGLAMARDMEAAASKPVLAAVSPVRPSRPIRTAELPPSEPAAPPVEDPAPQPVKAATTKSVAVNPKPAQIAVAASPGGAWRVQLAAATSPAAASSLWNNLNHRIGALGAMQVFYQKAGTFTRVQAGPLASKAAAERLCAAVKARGQACFPVGS
jgi:uncharacterized protein